MDRGRCASFDEFQQFLVHLFFVAISVMLVPDDFSFAIDQKVRHVDPCMARAKSLLIEQHVVIP